MQATELRIGNWVLPGNSEVAEKVTHLTDGAINTWHESLFRPIPLTEEWLKRLGFEQHLDYKNLHFFKEFRYDTKSGLLRILRPCRAHGESQRDACGFPFLTDDIPCLHVHRVQNIVHALTGQELQQS